MERRIHILGASGAGTTTLGSALSKRFAIPHFDTDDYYWVKTETPFTEPRERKQRAELLNRDMLRYSEWVSSGSFVDWGDFAIPLFTMVVFLWIPHDLRMERIKDREIERYGVDAISPGGWFHENHKEFIAYASAYDTAGLDVDIRSMKLHEQWMSKLTCRLLRIATPSSIQELTITVERELNTLGSGG